MQKKIDETAAYVSSPEFDRVQTAGTWFTIGLVTGLIAMLMAFLPWMI